MGGNTGEVIGQLIGRKPLRPADQLAFAREISAYAYGLQNEVLTDRLLDVGYTKEELNRMNFGSGVDVESFRTRNYGFDYNKWKSSLTSAKADNATEFSGLYSRKFQASLEAKDKAFNVLKDNDPSTFAAVYAAADLDTKNRYLYSEYKDGNLSGSDYKESVVNNLALDGKKVAVFDGQYYYLEPPEGSADTGFRADGGENGSNKFYKINFFPSDFAANSTSRMKDAGMGTHLLRSDTPMGLVVGVDDLGQLLVTDTAPNITSANAFLEYGIGTRGGQVSDPTRVSGLDEFTAILRTGASILTGGASEAAYVAYKGLKGDTLKTEDWLKVASYAFQEFGQEWLSKQSANGQEAMANADVVAEQAVTDAANADPYLTSFQAEAVYDTTYETAMANSGVATTFLGVDLATIAEISDAIPTRNKPRRPF